MQTVVLPIAHAKPPHPSPRLHTAHRGSKHRTGQVQKCGVGSPIRQHRSGLDDGRTTERAPNGHPGDVAGAPPQLKGDYGEVFPGHPGGAQPPASGAAAQMAAGVAADEEETVVEVVEDDDVTDPPCSCRYSGVSGTRLKGTVSDAPSPAPPDPANIATVEDDRHRHQHGHGHQARPLVVLSATLRVVVATGRRAPGLLQASRPPFHPPLGVRISRGVAGSRIVGPRIVLRSASAGIVMHGRVHLSAVGRASRRRMRRPIGCARGVRAPPMPPPRRPRRPLPTKPQPPRRMLPPPQSPRPRRSVLAGPPLRLPAW